MESVQDYTVSFIGRKGYEKDEGTVFGNNSGKESLRKKEVEGGNGEGPSIEEKREKKIIEFGRCAVRISEKGGAREREGGSNFHQGENRGGCWEIQGVG